MSFWDKYGKSIAEEAMGGARTVGLCRIEFGYKCYVRNFPSSETWFPLVDTNSKAEKKKVYATANAMRKEAGSSKRPQHGIQITRFKDNTARLNDDGVWEEVGWTVDLTENVDSWHSTKTARGSTVRIQNPTTRDLVDVPISEVPKLKFDILGDSLDDAGIPKLPWQGYCTLRWVNDPAAVYFGEEEGMVDDDGQGNARYPRVCIPVDIFASVEEARAAIGTGEASAPSPAGATEAWDESTWQTLLPELSDLKVGGASTAQIAKDYGVGVGELVKRLKAYAEETGNDIPF